MKKTIILLSLISSLGLKAQTEFKNVIGKKGLTLLQNLEINIISLVPTVKKYKAFNENVKNIPSEYLKYIDSIDYSKYNKKLSVIQIYSQDRSYRSKNSYNITKMKKKDSLFISNINFNMEIKDNIIDYQEYKNKKFEYKIVEKEIEKNKNRIVIIKTTIEN